MDQVDSPLRSATPPAWAAGVMRDPPALLNDHAHLEKKAAANALDMMQRWPEPAPPHRWVQFMTAVSRDEVEHLGAVLKLLHQRGGTFTKSHRNPYAKALRQLVRPGPGRNLAGIMDRLMVSALIELRSCERFAVLAEHCGDQPLAKLYHGLWASEHGHYQTFLAMARTLPGADDEKVDARWGQMLDAEAAILAEQPVYCGMHSGVADE